MLSEEQLRAAASIHAEISFGAKGLCRCRLKASIPSYRHGRRGRFLPTLQALSLGRRCFLANKRHCGWPAQLMTRVAQRVGRELLPVDSEPNALSQCMPQAKPFLK